MQNIICPISTKRVNENVVRLTALQVVILLGVFLMQPNVIIPLFLLGDFFMRAFTKAKFSPLSFISYHLIALTNLEPVMIDKAPKIFAARIGFLFSLAVSILFLSGLAISAFITASVLVIFAFLECGVNFCAGCWVYTYIVLPVYNKK